jgi:hypothetical protein
VACDTCHGNFIAFRPAVMNHTGTTGQCSTCHNGTYVSAGTEGAQAKPVSHIPTTGQCDNCHKNFVTFKPASMSHTGTNGQCSTCHNGGYIAANALAKPATHVATTAQCDVCHTTTAWKPATSAHDATAAGRCSTCHNGSTATGKNASHIPDGRQCDTCHKNYTAFAPATMNHTGLANQCSNCHNGSYLAQNAQAKSASHLVTTAQCDSCHKSTVTWATVTVNHASFSPPVTMGDHSCANCHKSGGTGLPKPTTHIPTTAACDTCHRNFTAFAPASMSHTGTAGQCTTCHAGGYTSVGADAKPGSHMPTTSQCDVCHTTSAWKPTSFSHSGVAAGTCASCHNGTSASGKPAGHIPTSLSCDACHKTIAWLPLVTPFSHTGVTAGSCATCHTSGYTHIDVKPASHIPTTAACDACHRTTAWLPLKTPYAHTGIAPGTCTSCHTPPYTSITVKPANHIPTSYWPSCDACHKSYTSFANARIHSTAFTSVTAYPGTCAMCHERGNPYGLRGRPNDDKHRSGTGLTGSCDSSGCHRSVREF